MDASLVPAVTGTNEAQTHSYILSPINSSPVPPHSLNNLDNESINLIPKLSNFNSKGIAVSVSYMTENNERKNSKSTIKNCEITQKNTISSSTFACHSMLIGNKNQKSQMTSIMTNSSMKSDDNHCINLKKVNNAQCFRSVSSPQLTFKPLTRSKVYRKASLKSSTNKSSLQSDLSTFTIDNFNVVSNIQSMNTTNNSKCILSKANKYRKTPEKCPIQAETCSEKSKENDSSIANSKNKWNIKDVHITCNPLSTPYPYSTPCQKTASGTVTETQDEEPKSRSCGSFLPILSLIPQTVISFQYLSPKMKFSWWRNKIS
ncbi:uncharacterized protein LOC122524452 [Polistes fuscatus]|uniref:uncharacterized protein LOC122524452 n=1 Tax=Polistes fuscatus TaxID=30207 RepID=UPI001CA8F710|nr:uncharacterized protein LOC122524452 [Polistes fuscatus]